MKAEQSDAEQSDSRSRSQLDSRAAPSPKAGKNWASGSNPRRCCRAAVSAASPFGTPCSPASTSAALLQSRLDQADLRWSVGRVTSMMLLVGVIALAVLMRLVPLWAALLGAAAAACRALRLHSAPPQQTLPEVSREFSRCAGFAGARAARRLSAFGRHGNDRERNRASRVGRDAPDFGRGQPGPRLAARARKSGTGEFRCWK